ncbi:MAG: nucleoside hydrolase [Planctomycetaceae bacterium]
MARKVIIDCDPGIDDAIAICMALFDPRLEVLAITATPGTVASEQSTANVRGLLNHLDPPRYPRIGAASPCDDGPVNDDTDFHGPDGLAGWHFDDSDRQHRHPSDKVIGELLRLHPGQITLLCCGPLTNIARAFSRDPGLMEVVDKVVISGGTYIHSGNVTPAAESNMHFDPQAAREVFFSATTKSLVPLDVTEKVTFGVDLLESIPKKFTRAGDMLHRLLPFAFRAAHERLGREAITLHDPTALLAVLEPDLFKWREMAGDVETRGELTRGATIFDRRVRRHWQFNMEVAIDVDAGEAAERIIRGLRFAGQQT